MFYYKNKSFYSEFAEDIPAGAIQLTDEQFQEIEAGLLRGKILAENADGFPVLIVPEPTPEEIVKGYEDAVQAYLDKTAQSRDYDNTYTCLSYLSSTDAVWNREANAFNAWRDQVWRKCHEVLNAVLAGEIAPPTVEELLALLPVIDWNDPISY